MWFKILLEGSPFNGERYQSSDAAKHVVAHYRGLFPALRFSIVPC